jgi:predicted TIM-barrel fold metal-dependent hydrolase
LSKINEKIIKKIIQKHNHVFFDTAASSPRMISEFIKIASPERVVLGSDGIYNRMSHSIDLVYRGVKRSGVKDVDKAMCQILGDNYKNKILGK